MERAIHEQNLSADKKISWRKHWDWHRDKQKMRWKRYNLKGRLAKKPALIARIEINITRLMIRTTCETLHVIVFPIQRKFTLKTLQTNSQQEPGNRRIERKKEAKIVKINSWKFSCHNVAALTEMRSSTVTAALRRRYKEQNTNWKKKKQTTTIFWKRTTCLTRTFQIHA